MERCPNCSSELEGWTDVTIECKARLALTSTKEVMGYIIISHYDNDIGSFKEGDDFSYYSLPSRVHGEYKVVKIRRATYHPYFQVFFKKGGS